MQESNTGAFSITYTASEKDELEQIKEKYTVKQTNVKMKKLQSMDKNVDFISTIISVFIGICGTCLFIAGTIRIIKGFSSVSLEIATSAFGLFLIATVPFIHTKIYNYVKQRYTPKILALIKDIEQNQI